MIISKDLNPRLKVESFAILVRSLLLWLLLTRDLQLLSFAISQLVYILILLFGYPLLLSKKILKVEDAYLPNLDEIRVVKSLPERREDRSTKNYFSPYVLDYHVEKLSDFTKAAVVKFVL